MPVYVDAARHDFGRMKLGHMVADTPEELHNMAELLGLRREWYQRLASWPHYDVSLSKRRLAIHHGAKTLTTRELGRKIKELRECPVRGPLWRADAQK